MKRILLVTAFLWPMVIWAQNIVSITPKSAFQGESVIIKIKTDGTLHPSSKVKLVWGSLIIEANSSNIVNDSLINAAFSFGSGIAFQAAIYDVVIYTTQPNFSATLPNAFELKSTAPAILSITPTAAKQGDTIEVIIKARNTHFLQAASNNVILHYEMNTGHRAQAFSVTAIDNVTIKAKIAISYAEPVGKYDVFVSNSIDQQVKLASIFTINPGPFPPQLVSVSPASGYKMDSLLITIKGKNTFFKRDSNSMFIKSGVHAVFTDKVNRINDTTMTAFLVFNNFIELGILKINKK
jgi:hypothetical protein